MRGAPPEGIRPTHRLDQRADVDGDWRSTETGGTPAPLPGEQATMPSNDCGGFHDLHGFPPPAPRSCEQHPEESVGSTEPKPSRCGLLKNGELVAERQDLGLEFGPSAEAGSNRGKEGGNAWAHDG
jgi:hypothetical protein